jgi:predicted N-acyltransferase
LGSNVPWTQTGATSGKDGVGLDAQDGLTEFFCLIRNNPLIIGKLPTALGQVRFERLAGAAITDAHWDFFLRCSEGTYSAHGSTPYLNRGFFASIGRSMPGQLILVLALRDERPIAASLLVRDERRLYGRYWGAVEHLPCLHFETAYYQPLEFCIERGIPAFEGGAQGEHKMARGFLPQQTWSAHWLAHPGFSDAVERFLAQEGKGVEAYVGELNERSPFK